MRVMRAQELDSGTERGVSVSVTFLEGTQGSVVRHTPRNSGNTSVLRASLQGRVGPTVSRRQTPFLSPPLPLSLGVGVGLTFTVES